MNPILYVVLNKELEMSAGKAAAQAVHAAMMLEGNYGRKFSVQTKRTVIVLEAETAEQIRNLSEYLDGAEIFNQYYIDEGENEVNPYSITALAVEPFESDDTEKREIFENLSLFSGRYDETATRYTKAADALTQAVRYEHERPWFLKKTIKWLRKQK